MKKHSSAWIDIDLVALLRAADAPDEHAYRVAEMIDGYRPKKVPHALQDLRNCLERLAPDEWEVLAKEMRGEQPLRIFNDNMLIALLKNWVYR